MRPRNGSPTRSIRSRTDKDAVHAVADTAAHTKDEVAFAVDGSCAATRQSPETIGKDVGDRVRKYPLAALAVGLGIGMLVGRTTGRV